MAKAPRRPPPQARSGLPGPLERRLLKPYCGSATGRVGASAVLRALSVLVRRHPRAALDALWAGAVQAGRTGLQEARHTLAPPSQPADPPLPPGEREEARRELFERLGRRELRQLRKFVAKAQRRRPGSDAPPGPPA